MSGAIEGAWSMVRIRNSQGYLELDESKLGAVLAAARWAVSSRPSQQKRDDKHTADGGNETESFRVCLPHGAAPALDASALGLQRAGARQLGSKGTNAPHYQKPYAIWRGWFLGLGMR
jgi:hypothetical protein